MIRIHTYQYQYQQRGERQRGARVQGRESELHCRARCWISELLLLQCKLPLPLLFAGRPGKVPTTNHSTTQHTRIHTADRRAHTDTDRAQNDLYIPVQPKKRETAQRAARRGTRQPVRQSPVDTVVASRKHIRHTTTPSPVE